MPPNTYKTSYLTKKEALESFYNKYLTLFGDNGQNMMFVTIQPKTRIYSAKEANTYISNLLPEQPPYILVLEQNSSLTHYNGYADFNLEPELHIHLFIAKDYLSQLSEIVYYKEKNHLNKIKKQMGCRSIHIVSRQVTSDFIYSYLSKQLGNTLPASKENFALNYQKRISINIYSKQTKEEMNKRKKTETNLYPLIQLLYCGKLYAEVKREGVIRGENLQEQNRVHTYRALIDQQVNERINKEKKQSPQQVYKPYLPNAPIEREKEEIKKRKKTIERLPMERVYEHSARKGFLYSKKLSYHGAGRHH
ncbi:MAG TPA: hypothetical protein VGC65_10950 [Bacteroidia bacterium]|jgi:hypothetical protein